MEHKSIEYKKDDIVGPYGAKLISECAPYINPKTGIKRRRALFQCSLCDNTYVSVITKVATGWTRSCGCSRKFQGYNFKTTRLYSIWKGIKRRTLDTQYIGYKNYGGRGIEMCEEWVNYDAFEKWAISCGYKEGLTIERINNDLGYSPDNCCFMPLLLNNMNKRRKSGYGKSEYGITSFITGAGVYYKVAIQINKKRYCNAGSRDYAIAIRKRDELIERLRPQFDALKADYERYKKMNPLLDSPRKEAVRPGGK